MISQFPRSLKRSKYDDSPSDALPPGEYTSGGEYLVEYCPSCGKKKHFYFNPTRTLVLKNGDTVTGFGWCHVCQFKIIGWAHFKKVFADDLKYTPPPAMTERVVRDTRVCHPEQWDNAWDHPRSRHILMSRRIPESLARSVPLGYVEEEDSLTVEIDSPTPELPSRILYRRLSGSIQKWIPLAGTPMANYGFGIRHLHKSLRAIVLVEGAFDILSSGLCGYGVALLGTSINDTWASWIKHNFKAVAIWMDPDDAGKTGARKIGKRMDNWGIRYKIISHPVDPKNHCPTDFSIIDLKKKLEDVK